MLELAQQILDSESEDTTDILISDLVKKKGWEAIYDQLITILKDSDVDLKVWGLVGYILFDAILDNLKVNENEVIYLLYFRLIEHDEYENLCWSVASHVKGKNHMESNYDPMCDPHVIVYQKRLT